MYNSFDMDKGMNFVDIDKDMDEEDMDFCDTGGLIVDTDFKFADNCLLYRSAYLRLPHSTSWFRHCAVLRSLISS